MLVPAKTVISETKCTINYIDVGMAGREMFYFLSVNFDLPLNGEKRLWLDRSKNKLFL